MRDSKVLFCLLVVFAVLLGAEEKPKDSNDFLLSKYKAWSIEIGMTIDALYTKYARESTNLVDLYLEGTFSPAVEIYLSGKEKKNRPSVVAEIGCQNGFVVWRINVYDKRFRTDKGIGVGSTLGDIRKSYKVDWIAFGEGLLFARVEEIGMSFALDIVKVPPKWYETRDQNLIPDSAKVVSVLID